MPKVLLCLGSNHQQARNMAAAADALATLSGTLRLSRSLWTLPVGMVSPLYLNQLAWMETDLSYDQLRAATKTIERQLGRGKSTEQSHTVPVDIDILQYGDTRYKPDDWERHYVRQLINAF